MGLSELLVEIGPGIVRETGRMAELAQAAADDCEEQRRVSRDLANASNYVGCALAHAIGSAFNFQNIGLLEERARRNEDGELERRVTRGDGGVFRGLDALLLRVCDARNS